MIGRKWFERQSKQNLPAWQRAALLCYSRMDRTSHCPLQDGELAKFLGTSPREAGRAVRTAIERGWLSADANARCLVAPYEFAYGAGNWKPARAVCPFHEAA